MASIYTKNPSGTSTDKPIEVRYSNIGAVKIYPYSGDSGLPNLPVASQPLAQRAFIQKVAPSITSSQLPLEELEIDVSQYVTQIQIVSSLDMPGGQAAIALNLTEEEASFVLPGSATSAVDTVSNQLKKNLRTGSLVAIFDDYSATGRKFPIFIGFVVSISMSEGYSVTGVPNYGVNLQLSNWLYPATIAQLKQVPVSSREPERLVYLSELFSKINNAALASLLDSSEGFMKELFTSIKSNTDLTTPAQFLQGVVRALFQYTLPEGFLGAAQTLGDNVVVLDGGEADMANIFGAVQQDELDTAVRIPRGNNADIIKSDMFTKFSALSANNLTHMDLINTVFMGLPQLIEMFPIILPARKVGALTAMEIKYGVCLAIMYRYKPCTPVHGPTLQGYNRFQASTGGLRRFTKPTAAELFYGPTLARSYYKSVNREFVQSINRNYNDSAHINAVFVERPFFSGDAHQANLIQSSAPLVADSTDINRYGMRCFSTASPFYSTKVQRAARTLELTQLSLATSERLFHLIAGAAGLSSGDIQLTHPVDALHYLDKIVPGIYLVIPSTSGLGGGAPESPDNFTCYVRSVSVSFFFDSGMPMSIVSIGFERGSYGARIPLPDTTIAPTVQPSRVKSRRVGKGTVTQGTPEITSLPGKI